MAQYIDKSALMAEIEKTEEISKDAADKAVDTYFKIHFDGWVTACRSILSFIDTLEVKEVDLEKEMGKYLDANDIEFSYQIKLLDFAKHFFELGLKAQKGG